MRKSLAYTMAALLSAATASMALAQPAPGPGAAAQQRRADNRAFSRPSERVEARLAYIKTALKITDAQQTQWNGFADAMRKNAKDMDQRMQAHRQQGDRRGGQRPNAIERLERLQSFHADAVTRLNDLIAAEKPLYAALSPEQKRVADVVLTPGGGRMHGMMMQHGGFRRG